MSHNDFHSEEISTLFPQTPSESSHATSNCIETVEYFTWYKGFSCGVTSCIASAQCHSFSVVYQLDWDVYWWWCKQEGRSLSRNSIPKIASFLLYLWHPKSLSLSPIKRYCFMLSSIFHHKDLDITSNQDLHNLIHSFLIEFPRESLYVPYWNLDFILNPILCSMGQKQPTLADFSQIRKF